MRGLGLGFTNPVGTGGMLDVCVFLVLWCGWCRWGVGSGGSKDNSLQAVELSGHQTCKLLSPHPYKPFPRRFSGSESV